MRQIGWGLVGGLSLLVPSLGAAAAPTMSSIEGIKAGTFDPGFLPVDGPGLVAEGDDGVGTQGIVNGDVAYDHAEVVALVMSHDSYGDAIFCSGTLIDDTWVLTAAHCVEALEYYEAWGFYGWVAVGGGNLYTEGIDDYALSERTIAHPDYDDRTLENDIGLMELQTPISSAVPAVLNDEVVNSLWYGKEMVFFGFGITDDGRTDSGTKHTTEIEVFAHDSYVIYSYDPSTNICSGDSGGSAFEQTNDGLELAGVNSFGFNPYGGYPYCDGGANGVSRVDIQIDWIQGYAPDVAVDWESDPPDTETEPPDTEETEETETDDTGGRPHGPGPGNRDTGDDGGSETAIVVIKTVQCACDGGSSAGAAWLGLAALAPFVRRRAKGRR